MMNTRIDEVSRQYMYAVQPVHLFETKKTQQNQKSTFDLINQMYSSNQDSYNPFHPNVRNGMLAKKLDISG